MTTAAAYVPDTGDLIWTDFRRATRGREQAGRRPALVVICEHALPRTRAWLSFVRSPRVSVRFQRASCYRRVCRLPADSAQSHSEASTPRPAPSRYAGAATSLGGGAHLDSRKVQRLHHYLTILSIGTPCRIESTEDFPMGTRGQVWDAGGGDGNGNHAHCAVAGEVHPRVGIVVSARPAQAGRGER